MTSKSLFMSPIKNALHGSVLQYVSIRSGDFILNHWSFVDIPTGTKSNKSKITIPIVVIFRIFTIHPFMDNRQTRSNAQDRRLPFVGRMSSCDQNNKLRALRYSEYSQTHRTLRDQDQSTQALQMRNHTTYCMAPNRNESRQGEDGRARLVNLLGSSRHYQNRTDNRPRS